MKRTDEMHGRRLPDWDAPNADANRLANDKSLAHVTFRGDAVCGAELTGASPEGLDKCEACIDVLIEWILAHDLDVAHAVALERLAIVKMLEGYAESTEFYGQKNHAPHIRKELGAVARNLRGAASEIRDGAHNEEAGK